MDSDCDISREIPKYSSNETIKEQIRPKIVLVMVIVD